jgi:F420-0:gamma-glutamyl ligase-like protein
MTTVRITNGFGDIEKGVDGIILTGELLSGEVNEGDFLIIDGDTNVLIKKVELDTTTFTGTIHVRLFVTEENKIVWYKLYGNVYEISK